MGVARLTQAERTALSDRRMRDSAIELIVAQGTTAMSLKQVGEAAGYSRGLASQRFGSKDGLFSFIVRSVGEDWLAKLKQATQGRSGYGALCAATDEHLRVLCGMIYDCVCGGRIRWGGYVCACGCIWKQEIMRGKHTIAHESRTNDA